MTTFNLTTKDFYFDLPKSLIAQTPIENRASSKMMVLNRKNQTIEHHHFHHIIEFLHPGDCLVLNDTKVIPARLFGKKETGAVIELLLLNRVQGDVWEALAKPAKRLKPGNQIIFSDQLKATVLEDKEEGIRKIQFYYEGIFETILDELGEMPLPPYISEKLADKSRYQTVYAKYEGSAAAPTAGLHFTPELLSQLENKGIQLAYLTLHVGLGTFRPVKVDKIEEHNMHSEFFNLNEENAAKIQQSKKNGGRLISVGTTTTRTLETIWTKRGKIIPDQGWTDIFIYPGYSFGAVEGLITNFHLPESTLLMLVSAFSEREFILSAYKEAVLQKYRFFSFGDAMLIY